MRKGISGLFEKLLMFIPIEVASQEQSMIGKVKNKYPQILMPTQKVQFRHFEDQSDVKCLIILRFLAAV